MSQTLADVIPVDNIKKYAIRGGIALAVLFTIMGSYYTVDPTERAGVRMFGTVQSVAPVGQGLHFKVPFITSVDKIQVSLTTVHVPEFFINTIDNQRISMEINVSYEIPDVAVFHLMYGVGRSGAGDIQESILPIIKDRVSRIIASKNTNNISADREKIQNEITQVVHDAVNDLFKIDVKSLQIASINYSQAFVDSNNNAVLAKNAAVAEENKVRTAEYQAQQKVATAKGEAQMQVAQAEGANKSTILNAEAMAKSVELAAQASANATLVQAEADKKALEMRGIGTSLALKASVDAIGGPDKYVAMLQGQALMKWNGTVPSFVMSDKAGAMMPLILNSPLGK